MEKKLAMIITKKVWRMIRVSYFMLRKGISKAKLLADLSLVMKRRNLIFHHSDACAGEEAGKEYEFSCSNTPKHHPFHLPFHIHKRSQNQPIDRDVLAAAIELVNSSATASPAWVLPGFGKTPVVRQLRITDSPFPLREMEVDDRVDEAAEEFIMRFYRDLKQQNAMG